MMLRTAYIPQTEPGVGRADGSRFNGPACLPRGAAWPRCGACGSPMPLFLQLDLGDLPAEHRAQHGEGLLQIFFCTDCRSGQECQVIDKAHCSLVVSPAVQFPATPHQIVGWRPSPEPPSDEEDLPGFDAHPGGDDDDNDNDDEAEPYRGDKLGGGGHWIQFPDYGACPICHEQMTALFQIGAVDHVPYHHYDGGIGTLTQRRNHPRRVEFRWQYY